MSHFTWPFSRRRRSRRTVVAGLVAAALGATLLPAGVAAGATPGAAVSTQTDPGPPAGAAGAPVSAEAGTVPDPLLDGTPLAPSRGRQIPGPGSRVKAAPRATDTAPFTYNTLGYTPQAVPEAVLPYNGSVPTPREDTRTHDEEGVRMYSLAGALVNHPVGQAGYGLENINAYRLTGDNFYLDRAIKQARRLVDTRHESTNAAGVAWFYPYPFDFALHSDTTDMRLAPWYSGMAQGQALSLFSRLATITADPQWRAAADATLNSFLSPPSADAPWVVHADTEGYLWLEEYPKWPTSAADFTFNGHMFAVFGFYDYWTVTASPVAAQLFDGGVTTVRAYVDDFRRTNFRSVYCLAHDADGDKYHQVHIAQLLTIFPMVHDTALARYADAFRADYPKPTVSGTVRFAQGTWTGYKFDKQGTLLGSKAITLSRASSAPGTARQRIKGRAVFYQISAGSLAGYWVQERYGQVWMQAKAAENLYTPQRRVTFPAGGTYTGYSFSDQALVTGHRTYTFSQTSSAPFDRSAYINARLYLRVTAGSYAGLWVTPIGLGLD